EAAQPPPPATPPVPKAPPPGGKAPPGQADPSRLLAMSLAGIPPSGSPVGSDPASPPSAAALHHGFVLADGVNAFKRWLPAVPDPVAVVRHYVDWRATHGAPKKRDETSPGDTRRLLRLVTKDADVSRLHAHSSLHGVWATIVQWLPDRQAYLDLVCAMAEAWRQEAIAATASVGSPAVPPTEFCEAVMFRLVSRPLTSLGVRQWDARVPELGGILDMTKGQSGYLSTTAPPLFPGVHPRGVAANPPFLWRVPLPADLQPWNGQAEVLQETIFRRLEGTSPVLDVCTRYADARRRRDGLLTETRRLTVTDLAQGPCDRCAEPAQSITPPTAAPPPE
ncbi:MAG TPA: hypothetical protein VNL71_18640, partial [Chloroflexota bacterium]|nr:hypothetical protein [Chloroflexota bacterium]